MREALFRGKTDAKTWVYGSLVYSPSEDQYYIVEHIGDKTIGQYTGLTDINGNKIFEGDIVTMKYGGYEEYAVCVFDSDTKSFKITAHHWDILPQQKYLTNLEVKVVGNIYDNPELLEDTNESIDY